MQDRLIIEQPVQELDKYSTRDRRIIYLINERAVVKYFSRYLNSLIRLDFLFLHFYIDHGFLKAIKKTKQDLNLIYAFAI